MSIDFGKITEIQHVQEVREVVGIWEIIIDQCPVDFKVKVIRTECQQVHFQVWQIMQ